MVDIDATQDYYEILAVPVDADAREIRRAYRHAAREFHPDKAGGNETRFRQIQEAYEVLGDSVYRQAYDSQRQARGLQSRSPISLDVQLNTMELQPVEGEQMAYAIVTLKPNVNVTSTQRHLNLVLVIDRSTSMLGDRMRQVQLAANDLLGMLRPDDYIALVTYSDRAEVVAPSMPASNTVSLKSAIASITPSGGTEIFQGLSAGISQVYKNYDEDAVNHIILMTDGRTYGDEELTLEAARGLGQQGIGVSAFGIGEDWNDRFLEELARRTGRNAEYISRASMVRDVLCDQVKEMTNLALKNARLFINATEYVRIRAVYKAAPHMQTMQLDDDDSAYVGGVAISEPTVFAVEFAINQSDTGERRIARIELFADSVQDGSRIQIHKDLHIMFKPDPVILPPSPKMLNILSRLNVYQLQESAWRAYEHGDTFQATRMLKSAATRLFDLGYDHLGQAAMLEASRLAKGDHPTDKGRKEIRFGTRALTMPTV